MIKLTCKSTFGFFAWIATVMVSQEVLVMLAAKGLLQILQRSPASEAEKAMANALKLWGEKRPKDFERKDIPFSEESATILRDKLGAKHEIADGVFIQAEIETAYHPLGEGTLPKFVEEIKIADRHVKAGDFAQWMVDKVGAKFTVQDYENEDTRTQVLLAIKALVAKLRASA